MAVDIIEIKPHIAFGLPRCTYINIYLTLLLFMINKINIKLKYEDHKQLGINMRQ